MDSFTGRVAVVTGGGSGIGREVATRFAGLGTAVVVADIDEARAAETASEIHAEGGDAVALRVDVTSAADTAAMVATALERWGRLDFAVNSAGIGGARARTAELDEETWSRVLAVNLTGTWLSMKAEIPPMVERGSGCVINLSSVAGVVGYPGQAAYAASKHGVIGLTRTAALEYARRGVRVNAVCPAFTRTPMVESLLQREPEMEAKLQSSNPSGRFATVDEIAPMIIHLCADSSAFVTGQSIVLDGGLTAG